MDKKPTGSRQGASTPMQNFAMSKDQYDRLLENSEKTRSEMVGIRMEVAETKGVISTFTANLREEREARESLGRQVSKHDQILRGDGLGQAGVVERIQDVSDRADQNAKDLAALKKLLVTAAITIGTPLAVDILIRLVNLAYTKGVIP